MKPTFFKDRLSILFISVAFLALQGCSPSSLDPGEFSQWIAREESGLVQSKSVNHVTMRARFLPSEYLAYREYTAGSEVSFDSLQTNYKCGLTFQFSLQADKADKVYGSLIHYNLQGDQDFLNRSQALSFDIQHFISLQQNGKTYEPVLSQYEGFNAVSNSINFQIVFHVEEYACGKGSKNFQNLTLVFDDPFWNLGKNNFLFQKNNIVEIPKLKF